jgi:DNA repair exonuclease SbcCD ATPase subunit
MVRIRNLEKRNFELEEINEDLHETVEKTVSELIETKVELNTAKETIATLTSENESLQTQLKEQTALTEEYKQKYKDTDKKFQDLVYEIMTITPTTTAFTTPLFTEIDTTVPSNLNDYIQIFYNGTMHLRYPAQSNTRNGSFYLKLSDTLIHLKFVSVWKGSEYSTPEIASLIQGGQFTSLIEDVDTSICMIPRALVSDNLVNVYYFENDYWTVKDVLPEQTGFFASFRFFLTE